jgi:hypothetical protein
LLCLLLGSSFAHAQDEAPTLMGGDYGLENREWNGLSRFVEVGADQGIELVPASTLDLSTLSPQDRLVLVYPTRELDPDEFARFIVDGGRAILADDFGASSALLARLGIERVGLEGLGQEEFFLGRPGLPVFHPGGRHALLEGVEEVVANHPAALKTEGGAVLPYPTDGYGLAYDMRLGRGKVIVIGDASLLINHMVDLKDNRVFLRNALGYLCEEASEPCRPSLMVGDVELQGSYAPQNSSRAEVDDWLTEVTEKINGWLRRLTSGSPGKHAVFYASLLLLVGSVAFIVTVFPWKRGPRVVPQAGPPDGMKPLSDFEWNLVRYHRTGTHSNYALPLSILRSEFERLFFRELSKGEATPDPEDPIYPAFLRRMAQRYVDEHAKPTQERARAKEVKQVLDLLNTLSRLPPRNRLFLDNERYVAEKDLSRIYRQCRDILDKLGVGKEYERRARRPQG